MTPPTTCLSTKLYLSFADLCIESMGAAAQQFPHGRLSFRLVGCGVVTVFAFTRLRTKELAREALTVPVADRISTRAQMEVEIDEEEEKR